MDRIVIKGGADLKGSIRISGAKNSALPIIAGSLLTKEKVTIHNVPRLEDVHVMLRLLESIGAKIEFRRNTLNVRAGKLNPIALSDNPLARQIRYSTLLVGALLFQFKKLQVPLPGGCVIGSRKLDSHILGLKKLGAKIEIAKGYLKAVAQELSGCHLALEYPSVSATENIIIASCLARGTSVIENAAREPEIADLANFLNSMGSQIRGAGTNRIEIEGVENLGRTDYTIIPDRIETGTYMVAAAITKGKITLENADIHLMDNVVATLRKLGVDAKENHRDINIASSGNLCPVDIVTEVYPGFPTDMQPIVTPLLSVANGKSSIKETIFDQRFTHVPEMIKMGAKINVRGNTITIHGPRILKGSSVEALDIRGGGSLLVAGLGAKGVTSIDGAHQILRGYEEPVEKLKNVGARLRFDRPETVSCAKGE